MQAAQILADIEAANELTDLHSILQGFISNLGFAAYNFLDTGQPGSDTPYFFGTSGAAWENEYAGNNFVAADAAISKARRTNLPFDWRSVEVPENSGRHLNKFSDVMDAARDHGLREGLVVPLHFCDAMGRPCSCLTVLFWKDRVEDFDTVVMAIKHELHMVLLYWMHRANALLFAVRKNEGSQHVGVQPRSMHVDLPSLSARERDVLSWAAMGKTTRDTSQILSISDETVATHLRNARFKLNANNKSHAVALAMFHGLIDV